MAIDRDINDPNEHIKMNEHDFTIVFGSYDGKELPEKFGRFNVSYEHKSWKYGNIRANKR